MPVTFGTSLPSRGDMAGPDQLRSVAQRAEDLGYDHVWVSDHIILPKNVASFYPYATDGVPTFKPDEPYYEPLAALNFIAGCTKKVRLGTHVLIIPYRNPILTAKILSTLDVLSEGRVILGAGVGWMEEEFQAMGLDTYKERGAVTDEYLQIYKELWTKDDASFQGKFYQISDTGFEPKPIQKPHPPVWIGGHSGPAVRRAAKFGDGWMPIGLRPPAILEPEELAEKIAQLRKLTVAAGRPEDAVALTFSTGVIFNDQSDRSRAWMQGNPEQIASDLQQYQSLGVSNFIINFQGRTVPELQENMERFSREVISLIPE